MSDVKPLSDIVDHKKTGLIIPAHDEKKWAKAFEFIIKEKDEATKMGENGRRILDDRYSPDIMIKKIIGMYHDVLKK